MSSREFNFSDYQEACGHVATYPNRLSNLYYPVLGLVGEAGEVANKVKKIMRDEKGVVSPEKREQILDELGDVLWYISATCDELNATLESIARKNVEKLKGRRERGTLHGSGDNR